jgi:hypothetical protein
VENAIRLTICCCEEGWNLVPHVAALTSRVASFIHQADDRSCQLSDRASRVIGNMCPQVYELGGQGCDVCAGLCERYWASVLRQPLSLKTLTPARKCMGAIYCSCQVLPSGVLRLLAEPRIEALLVELAGCASVMGLTCSQLSRKRVTHFRDNHAKNLQGYSGLGKAQQFP